MEKRLIFNEEVQNYDKTRPKYCSQLFEDIMSFANIDSSKCTIEIGIGTGQATEPFLNKGCKVVAIEIGQRLAEFSKQKLGRFENLEIINTSFEDYTCEEGVFDLLYSATAFHWIPTEIGYKKAFDILKSNGTLALFWNMPCTKNNENFLDEKIQSIYAKYFQINEKVKEGHAIYTDTETIERFGFTDIKVKSYSNQRVFTAQEYIQLLTTYSDHRAMEEKYRTMLFNEIMQEIVKNNDSIKIYDTMQLYLAKKP